MTREEFKAIFPMASESVIARSLADPYEGGKNDPAPISKKITIYVEPMGAPRMTRADTWKKRPVVCRYRAYKDAIRSAVGPLSAVPVRVDWVVYLPMPASWSKKKKHEMAGEPHRSKPDRDNIDKGILDALFESDQGVAFGELRKYWCQVTCERIELTLIF